MAPPPSDNVRHLFKQQQSQRQQQNKIDHVFAKYDRQGRLGCVLCHMTVKSEQLWAPHLQSSKHKELLTQLKAIKQQQQQKSGATKRPLSDDQAPTGKSGDAALLSKRARFEQIEKEMEQQDDDDDDDNDEDSMDDSDDSEMDQGDGSALPADFFDTPAPSSKATQPAAPATNMPDRATSSRLGVHRDLPTGFFDDAKEEARARQTAAPEVLESQQLEDDYEAFKEMMVDTNEETDKMKEEDEETLLIDREVTLAREQLALDEKVQQLKRLRQQPHLVHQQQIEKKDDTTWAPGLKSSVRQTMMQQGSRKKAQAVVFDDMEEDDDDDEDDDNEWDWRAQHL